MIKKGAVVGGILSSPLMIMFIILIIGIFVFLSTGISIIKKPSTLAAPESYIGSQSNLLIKQIELNTQGENSKFLVSGALSLVLQNKISEEDFRNSLKPLESNGECYHLSYLGPNKGVGTNLNLGEEVVFGRATLGKYESQKIKTYIGSTEITYYYGPCP